MRSKEKILGNFTRAIYSKSFCLRPDKLRQIQDYLAENNTKAILARGQGLSYSDSCLLSDGYIMDTQRLNHFIHLEPVDGFVECQPAVTFGDLFKLHPDWIPPVFPGTAHATIAGGIAHDIHGKNNPQQGSLGQHILWCDLMLGKESIRCSPQQHCDLFAATIAGLGLTGIISRVGLRLKKASKTVRVQRQAFVSIADLLTSMSSFALTCDYQMAWLDLLPPKPRAILALANHSDVHFDHLETSYRMPKMPFCLLGRWNLKLFNAYVFKRFIQEEVMSLQAFNNPLDRVSNWNRCYGKKGLIQFQALFQVAEAETVIHHLIKLIKSHEAIPSLAVLKLFTQKGGGLLSFCKPGFTLAIDFICNKQAKLAIRAMNQYIAQIGGRIYLAKDLLLNQEQFESMYDEVEAFKRILSQYNSPMRSDLAKRIGLLA